MSLSQIMNTSNQKTKIVFGGGGNMGDAFAMPMAKNPANELVLIVRSRFIERSAQYAAYPNVRVVRTAAEAADDIKAADYFVFAVKPGAQSDALSAEISPHINVDTVGVSIMAGATTGYLKEATGLRYAARAMPNMPCALGQGMTTIYVPDNIPKDKHAKILNMLSSPDVGKAQAVKSEAMVDAGTAVSGSGPAYVYLFVQVMAQELNMSENDVVKYMDSILQDPMGQAAWVDKQSTIIAGQMMTFKMNMVLASVDLGFEQNAALEQVDQTIRGAIAKLKEDNRPSIADMINAVKSSKGTTQAALEVLDVAGQTFGELRARLKPAIRAAFDRGQEMGRDTLATYRLAHPKNIEPFKDFDPEYY